jgi:hypothetical protein
MNYYIIVYKSTHDAMEADKILSENSFEYRIMPTPTAINNSCGICTRLINSDDIKRIIEEQIVNYKGIYEKTENGFITIK